MLYACLCGARGFTGSPLYVSYTEVWLCVYPPHALLVLLSQGTAPSDYPIECVSYHKLLFSELVLQTTMCALPYYVG